MRKRDIAAIIVLVAVMAFVFAGVLMKNNADQTAEDQSVSESSKALSSESSSDESQISENSSSETASSSSAAELTSVSGDSEDSESVTGPWQDRLIAHAGGGIDGVTYTNSLEAFETAYANGLRTFEADMNLTSDNRVVLAHDWGEYISSGLEQGVAPTREEFLNIKIQDKYTPMDIEAALRFMDEYPDIWLVTDTKYTDEPNITTEFTDIYNTANELGLLHCLDRMVVQLYNPEMLSTVEKIYHFENYILTLYQLFDGSDMNAYEQYCTWCSQNNVSSITMWYYWCNEDTMSIANKYGLNVYVHTLDDQTEADKYFTMGVTGVYTDFLT